MVKGVGLFIVHACFSGCRGGFDHITPARNMGMNVGRFHVHVCFLGGNMGMDVGRFSDHVREAMLVCSAPPCLLRPSHAHVSGPMLRFIG